MFVLYPCLIQQNFEGEFQKKKVRSHSLQIIEGKRVSDMNQLILESNSNTSFMYYQV